MLRFFILFVVWTSLFSASVEEYRWQRGATFLSFLEKLHLPLHDLYYNLDTDDQRLTTEMSPGVKYQILKGRDGEIQQILLPLNSDLQLHIYKDNRGKYHLEAIPIIVDMRKEGFTLKITSSPNYNILKATHSKNLAHIFVSSFRNSLDFKNNIRRGDRLVMIYDQAYRLGNKFSMPILKVSMIETRGKKNYIYLNYDGNYYDAEGKRVEGFLLDAPVKYSRISSYFTKRRWHPILKRWKAHLGVDFAARRGTPIKAAGSGKIIYAARAGSYGNLVKIRHGDGYETRYAHMKSFRKGIRYGKFVKKGQVIGYVGTTGRSTGPHLHFELRKNGVALDPLKVVRITTKKLRGNKRKKFMALCKKYNKEVDYILDKNIHFKKEKHINRVCYFISLEDNDTKRQ